MTRRITARSLGGGSAAPHHRRHHHPTTAGASDSLFRWHDFLLRDAAHPHEIDTHIRSQDGPLRWLLVLRPPPHVVRSVLDAHRAAIFSAAARLANRRVDTALHQACALGSPAQIIAMILEEDRAAAQRRDMPDRETPLHVARDDEETTGALLEVYPRGALARDRFGGIPLHNAALCDSDAGPTKLLLEAGRSAEIFGPGGGSLEENYRGKTPLDLSCDYFASLGCGAGEELGGDAFGRWEKLETLAKAALEALEDNSNEDTDERDNDCGDGNSLVSSTFSDDCPEPSDIMGFPLQPQPFCILHALLELGCPTPVVLRALGMYPGQVSQRDAMGRLPLHLACGGGRQSYCPHKNENSAVSKPPFSAAALASEAVICALLDPDNNGYPCAAAMVDSKGRLPLHILVVRDGGRGKQRGKHPTVTTMKLKGGFLGEHAKDAGRCEALDLVFRASPRALETRDPVTGMFPFMLAAMQTEEEGEQEESNGNEEDDSVARLNIMYFLLRKAPAVLMRFSSAE